MDDYRTEKLSESHAPTPPPAVPDAAASPDSAAAAPPVASFPDLTPTQLEEFEKALVHSYPSDYEMERLVFYTFGEDLDAIISRAALQQMAFDLIQWAEAQGKLPNLVQGAYKRRPANALMHRFAAEIGLPPVEELPPDPATLPADAPAAESPVATALSDVRPAVAAGAPGPAPNLMTPSAGFMPDAPAAAPVAAPAPGITAPATAAAARNKQMKQVGQILVGLAILGAIFFVITGWAALRTETNPELHNSDMIAVILCPLLSLLLVGGPGAYLIYQSRNS